MDLSAASDDEVIAEVQRRLSEGRFGYHGLYSDNQRNAQALARAYTEWLREQVRMHEHSVTGYCEGLRAALRKWEDGGEVSNLPFKVFAVNTTRYNRPLDEITQSGFGRAA